MKRAPCFLIGFLLVCVVRSPAQVSFFPGDPSVETLQYLYLESGILFPTVSFPLARRDLLAFAERLYPKAPSDLERERIQAYLSALKQDPSAVRVGARIGLLYEKYLHTAELWPDFKRLFSGQAPFAALTLYCVQEDLAALFIESAWRREYEGFADSNLSLSSSGILPDAEFQSIQRGIFRYFVGPLELELARNQVHYGPAYRSSLLLSRELPFMDYIRYRLRLGPLTMSSLIANLENRAAVEDVNPLDYKFEENLILVSLHRFEWSWRRLSLGISGMSILAHKQNGFQLGEFLPVMSWHNANFWPHNLSLCLEIRGVPLRGLELFAQAGFDDINGNTFGISDISIPTIDAYIVGSKFAYRLGTGFLASNLEFGYTHYLWGNYLPAYSLQRAIYRIKLDQGVRSMPLTSPYGPGALWVQWELGWDGLAWLEPHLQFLFLSKNTAADLINTPYEASDAVAHAPRSAIFRFGFELTSRFLRYCGAYVNPSLLFQDGQAALELTLGASLTGDWVTELKK